MENEDLDLENLPVGDRLEILINETFDFTVQMLGHIHMIQTGLAAKVVPIRGEELINDMVPHLLGEVAKHVEDMPPEIQEMYAQAEKQTVALIRSWRKILYEVIKKRADEDPKHIRTGPIK